MILVSENEKYKVKNILKNKKNKKGFNMLCVEKDLLSIKIVEFLNII